MDNKDIFCFIPAKSTSQRLKNKNIKELDGKPMMQYVIDAAFKSNLFKDNIFLSTENIEYAELAKTLGCKVPQLRPKKLSFNPYGIKDVLLDFILKNPFLNEYKNVLILSPTSPLVSHKDICDSYKLFKEKKSKRLLSITEDSHNAFRSITINENKIEPLFKNQIYMKSQELSTTYRINGAIILLNLESFILHKNFFLDPVSAYIMPRERSVDVDTIDDFNFAEYLMQIKK